MVASLILSKVIACLLAVLLFNRFSEASKAWSSSMTVSSPGADVSLSFGTWTGDGLEAVVFLALL